FNASLFETNLTGSAQNFSALRFSGNIASFNATYPAGTFYGRFYANDSQNAFNVSSDFIFTIAKAQPVLILNNNTSSINTSGQVGYWKFDEGSGTTSSDSSGNANIGTLMNGATFTTSGKFGNAVSFNGRINYVNFSTTPSLNTTSISIVMWFNLAADPNCDGLNNWRSLIRKGGPSGADTGW